MMARSLDDLIEFLLGEIALSGQRGCSPREFLSLLDKFYSTTREQHRTNDGAETLEVIKKPTIDRAFQEQAWRWLTKHPDISVGKNGKYNKLSLSEVEAQNEGDGGIGSRVPNSAQPLPATGSSEEVLAIEKDPEIVDSTSSAPNTSNEAKLRIFVTEERMYLAICGHSKDVTRIFETEFALLSIIASTRSAGILQGDLVRESGQDKRSVPKRTDSLQRKGYIEKRAVHARGQRTSRLTLRKLVASTERGMITQKPVENSDGLEEQVDEYIDFKILIEKLFEILRTKIIVTRNDLRETLNLKTVWRRRVLARMICEFEALGCMKRVRAASEHSRKLGSNYACVKFLRDPLETDLQTYYDATSDLASTADDHEEKSDAEDGTEIVDQSKGDQDDLEEVERIFPQWNPDRLTPNLISEVVACAGTRGISNMDMRSASMGTFVRRTLEYLIIRLSSQWTKSQPPHLRHLAVIRDTGMTGVTAHYVHYSYPHFRTLVDKGDAFWEAVVDLQDSKKKGKTSVAALLDKLDAESDRDKFGFPKSQRPAMQYKNGQASLTEALMAAKPGHVGLATGEPVASTTESGEYIIRYAAGQWTRRTMPNATKAKPSPSPSAKASLLAPTLRQLTEEPRQKTIGRPRKFMSGTEKFWQNQFQKASGSKKTARVMSDAAGLSLFENRPADFDVTLVRATNNRLPVPEIPDDINQDWIDKTLAILNRSENRLYMSPKGEQPNGWKKYRAQSRVMILKSARLGEIDFSDRADTPKVRFISSSVAHTLIHRRYYFGAGPASTSAQGESTISSSSVDEASNVEALTPSEGPKLGTFHKESPQSSIIRQSCFVTVPAPVPPRREKKIRLQSGLAQRNSGDGQSPRQSGTLPSAISTTDPPLQVSVLQRASVGKTSSASHRTLPPPLTTRAASRRKSSQQQPASDISTPLPVLMLPDLEPQSGPMVSDIPATQLKGPKRPPSLRERPRSRTIHSTPTKKPSPSSGEPVVESILSSDLDDGHETQPIGAESATEIPRAESGVVSVDELALNNTIRNASPLSKEMAEAPLVGSPTVDSISVPVIQSETNEDEFLNSENLPELRVSDSEDDTKTPKKRFQHGVTGGSIGILRRKIVLKIIEQCGGAIPYHRMSLWNTFGTLWQKSGQEGKPDSRTVRATVKSLCESGKIKQMKFSHRDRKGVMVTKTILARADMEATDPFIRQLQRHIIDKEPEQYVPPMMEQDSKAQNNQSRESGSLLQQQHQIEVLDVNVETLHVPSRIAKDKGREFVPRIRWATHKTSESNLPLEAGNQITQPMRFRLHPLFVPRNLNFRIERPSDLLTSVTHSATAKDNSIQEAKSSTPRGNQGDNSASSATVSAAGATSRSRTRIGQQPNFTAPIDPEQRDKLGPPIGRIVWKQSNEHLSLPESLEDILSRENRPRKRYLQLIDPCRSNFDSEVERVARWEERSFHYFQGKASKWNFINHLVGGNFQPGPWHPLSGWLIESYGHNKSSNKRSKMLDEPSTNSSFISTSILPQLDFSTPRLTAAQQMSSFRVNEVQPIHFHRSPPKSIDQGAFSTRKRKRGPVTIKSRKRPKPSTSEPSYLTSANGDLVDVSEYINTPIRRARGMQHLRNMPEDIVYKITVTIVVVRTLSGGLDKYIDWKIVNRLFPEDDEQYIRDRWRTLQNKYRRDVSLLTESLQERFCDAYLNDEVPTINFDDMYNNDWEGIIEWALETLDKPVSRNVEELPGSRLEFSETKNMTFEEHRGLRELLGYNVNANIPVREAAQVGIVFAKTVISQKSSTTPQAFHAERSAYEDGDWEPVVAKSWARSTILTPEENFDAHACHEKLSKLARTPQASEELLDRAIKTLIYDRAITGRQKDKSTGLIGRSYQTSKLFEDATTARRPIQASMLRRAAIYKREVLDPGLTGGTDGSGEVVAQLAFHPQNVEDGDMVAILNLVAAGRIKLRVGDDVPRNRYGLSLETGYQTRRLGKEKLAFTVLMEMVPDMWIAGNPLLLENETSTTTSTRATAAAATVPVTPVPGIIASGPLHGAIPSWIDIHGSLLPTIWESVVAAVVGLVASRPGINAVELQKTLAPALTLWELELLLLPWLEAQTVLYRRRPGGGDGDEVGAAWHTTEWWWLVLDLGRGGVGLGLDTTLGIGSDEAVVGVHSWTLAASASPSASR